MLKTTQLVSSRARNLFLSSRVPKSLLLPPNSAALRHPVMSVFKGGDFSQQKTREVGLLNLRPHSRSKTEIPSQHILILSTFMKHTVCLWHWARPGQVKTLYRPLQSGEGRRVGGWGPYVELACAMKCRGPLKQVWAEEGPGVFSAPDPAQETRVLSRITDAQSRGEEWRRNWPQVGSWNTLPQAPCSSVADFSLREPNRKASPILPSLEQLPLPILGSTVTSP